ncbi:MAG: phenylalanine--tRNA ligase beta subunit-related protein [bacterium]
MNISYKWLNNFFAGKLPESKVVANKLMMSFLEVESVNPVGDDEILDVKVTPNLAHSALCHRGVARLVGAVIKQKPATYSRELKSYVISETNNKLAIEIEDEKDCRRYAGRVIEKIKIGPSPEWLKNYLEAFGQRSISNVVDATNFVMLEIGQPMHAFDASKLVKRDDKILIEVKRAKAETSITTLDKKFVELDPSILLITNEDRPLAIAGIKGGTEAEIDENTVDLVLESANFNPTLIRRTSANIKIQTDASKRYENDYSPELAGEAMDLLTSIIVEIAGTSDTKVGEVVDNYPRRANQYKVGVSLGEINRLLGLSLTTPEIENIFSDLGFEYKVVKPIDEVLMVAPTLVGATYRVGASVTYNAPKEFDCSGLVAYLYAQGGVLLPRMSIDQYVATDRVEVKDLKAGDLIFANSGEGKIHTESIEFMPGTKVSGGIDHVGLYLGNDEVVQATRYKNGVVIEKLSTSEQFTNIIGCGRVTDNTERWVVTIPVDRLDLRIKEDLIEDIAMVNGYEKIGGKEVKVADKRAMPDKSYYYATELRKVLSMLGFSEIYTYAFSAQGAIEVANPLNKELPFLRTDLATSVTKSLEFNARYTDLIGMSQIKVFEIGHVFNANGESIRLCLGVGNPIGVKGLKKEKDVLDAALATVVEKLGFVLNPITRADGVVEFDFNQIVEKMPEPENFVPDMMIAPATTRFHKISQYPFVSRDIAVFVPEGVTDAALLEIIKAKSGDLLVRSNLFDVFVKKFPDGTSKTSYAYRLVFQSYERTLSGEEIDVIMSAINAEVTAKGWQVR